MKKNALIIAVLTLAGFTSASALAADGEIAINGLVQDVTCAIDSSIGGKDFNVGLPMQLTNALQGDGDVAGTTPFSITVGASGTCPDSTKVAIVYDPSNPNINTVTGNLKNTVAAGSGGAENIEIQILDALNGDAPVKLHEGTATKDVEVAAGTASLDFKAQYRATGTATAGQVESSVAYSVTFP